MVPLVLIIIAGILIFINIKFGDKNNSFSNFIKSDFQDRSESTDNFKNQYDIKKINFTDDRHEIGQIRKDMAESLTELQKDIININKRIDNLENNKSNHMSTNKSKKIDKIIKDYDEKSDNKVYYDKQNESYEEKIETDDKVHSSNEFNEVLKSSLNKKHKKDKNSKYDGVINDISLDSKSIRIKKMIDEGSSIDEICEKLSVGKGEVLLVKGLYKK